MKREVKNQSTKKKKNLSKKLKENSKITNIYLNIALVLLIITIIFLITIFIKNHNEVNTCLERCWIKDKDYCNTLCSPFTRKTQKTFLNLYGLVELFIPINFMIFAVGRFIYYKKKLKKNLDLNKEVYIPIFIMIIEGIVVTLIVSLFMYLTNIVLF